MFETNEKQIEIPQTLLNFINKWKDKNGNLIMILHQVQEEYGFIPRDVALEVARLLNVPLAKIYGIITFYHFFKLEKPGRHTISVCLGTACYLKGGEDILKELESQLGIGVNGTTDDGIFSIQSVRCLGCCGLSPVLSIKDEVYGRLKSSDIPEIIAKYKAIE